MIGLHKHHITAIFGPIKLQSWWSSAWLHTVGMSQLLHATQSASFTKRQGFRALALGKQHRFYVLLPELLCVINQDNVL